MSSLASLFNSSASLFTVDVYEKLRPGQSQKHLLTVGRIATTVVVGLGIVWIPVMAKISQGGLYQYLQSVQGYLAPPITAVFLLGLFWKRVNAAGAVWGLGGGFVLGMAKLTIQTFYGKGKLESPAWLAAIGDFNFLSFQVRHETSTQNSGFPQAISRPNRCAPGDPAGHDRPESFRAAGHTVGGG